MGDLADDLAGKSRGLPDVPDHDDHVALRRWLNDVWRLDPDHPVTGALHQGLRGPDGHVKVVRVDAPEIRFEPASSMNTARRLLPMLSWQLLPTDGELPGFKDEHARRIAHVVRLLCGATTARTAADETADLVNHHLRQSREVEGHTTYGSSAQRYEAVAALSDERGQRHLIDLNTGELVVGVGDLNKTARSYLGRSLERGWLEARMEDLGFTRETVQGYGYGHGNSTPRGPHLRRDVFRGHLPAEAVDEA